MQATGVGGGILCPAENCMHSPPSSHPGGAEVGWVRCMPASGWGEWGVGVGGTGQGLDTLCAAGLHLEGCKGRALHALCVWGGGRVGQTLRCRPVGGGAGAGGWGMGDVGAVQDHQNVHHGWWSSCRPARFIQQLPSCLRRMAFKKHQEGIASPADGFFFGGGGCGRAGCTTSCSSTSTSCTGNPPLTTL